MKEPRPYIVMPEDVLMDLLRRASEGEDPDLLYAEWYANSDHEQVDGE